MSQVSRGVTRKVEFDVTVNTAIFASGDCMHSGIITLPNCLQGHNHSGTIVGLSVVDLASQNAPLSVLLFGQLLTTTIPVVNVALNLDDIEADNFFLGHIPVAAGNYLSLSTNSVATVSNINIPVVTPATNGRDLFAIVVCGGTPTYAVATDLRMKIYIRQD